MQKITVADIHIKTGKSSKGDWTNTTLTDESGGKFTSFDKQLSYLNTGAVIEAEVEIKGKFVNIKEWRLLEKGTEEPALVTEARKLGAVDDTMTKDDWADKDTRTRTSIERQVALKESVELAVHDKIDIKDIGAYARKFEEFLGRAL